MGTACGRASVLGSALIHTKTGAHREDVAQHAGDRFGSPITRRPDAAALSDGADSPPVSIPVLRMPPRKPQMTRRTSGSGAIVSICNSYETKPGLHVTDRDIQSAPWPRSRSVTSTGQIFLYVLQIETNGRHGSQVSQSVTVTEQNQPQMLQIETVELSVEEQSRSVTTRPRIPRQMLQIETNVPITNPDRQQKGPDVQPSQLERPAPSSTN